MKRPKKIKTASDLPVRTLRQILADTEHLAGPACDSAKALRRALTEAERRESAADPTPALQEGAAHA
jgi:hypothetical protein